MRVVACALTAAGLSLFHAMPTFAGDEEVVFSNLTSITSHALSINFETGNQVTLAGTNRHLTKIELAVHTFTPVTRDLFFRMYANDGPGGEPGTLLFDLFLDDFTHSGGGVQILSIDLGGFDAPDVLTWTLENLSGDSSLFLRAYNPPTVGSSANEYWVNVVSAWERQGPVSYGGNFGARIFAVPAPAASFSIASLALLSLRRRR